MAYVYKHFIPQNTAPNGAKRIAVYDGNGKKICTIPLGGLTPPMTEKRYSFGLLSDVHIQPWSVSNGTLLSQKFENALRWFNGQGANFVCITGDFVHRGFVNSGGTFVTDEFGEYKRICDLFPDLPIYECCGNHESYYSDITNNLTELETYTGNTLTYHVSYNNDLFVFIGQPSGSVVMRDSDFQWLAETLEANKDRRCFLFVHAYIEEDSGDPMDVRENSIFEDWGTSKKNAFMNLLRQYPNVVLFHGHSHTKFENQTLDVSANYTDKNGFKSVHVPSCAYPRDVVGSSTVDDYNASQGYIVDVYADCIVLNGWDFVNSQYVPLGVYKIAT